MLADVCRCRMLTVSQDATKPPVTYGLVWLGFARIIADHSESPGDIARCWCDRRNLCIVAATVSYRVEGEGV